MEFETGFTPFFKLFKVNRLFLTALVRSWLALLYTLHKLTSPCSCQKWPTSVGYQRQASISSASDFKLDHKRWHSLFQRLNDKPYSSIMEDGHIPYRFFPPEVLGNSIASSSNSAILASPSHPLNWRTSSNDIYFVAVDALQHWCLPQRSRRAVIYSWGRLEESWTPLSLTMFNHI